jgi:hypothetical protein
MNNMRCSFFTLLLLFGQVMDTYVLVPNTMSPVTIENLPRPELHFGAAPDKLPTSSRQAPDKLPTSSQQLRDPL